MLYIISYKAKCEGTAFQNVWKGDYTFSMKSQIFVHFSSVVFKFCMQVEKKDNFNMGLSVTTYSWKHNHLGQNGKSRNIFLVHLL